MAAYSATTFFLLHSSTRAHFSRNLSVRAASVTTQLRFRKQRKNYLRPKILKTLIKPQLPPLLPESPVPIPEFEDVLVDVQSEFPIEQLVEEELKESKSVEISVADGNNGIGKFSRVPIFKIGLFLVGAFVFHTICAVFIFGSDDSLSKDGILGREDEIRGFGLNGNGDVKSKYLMNRNGMVYVDEIEFQKKISEIQAMARDVRAKERRELKKRNNEGLVDEDSGVDVIGIEKEVNRRLEKLGKGLKKLSIGYTSKDKVDKDRLDPKDVNGAFIFKDMDFENPLIDSSDKQSGFQSLDDISKIMRSDKGLENGILEEKSDGGVGDNVQSLDQPTGDLVRNEPITYEEDAGSYTPKVTEIKLGKGKERAKLGKAKPLNGKVVKLDKSSNIKGSSSSRSTLNQDTSTIVIDSDLLRRDLKSRKVKHEASNEGARNKKSASQTDFWWLTLPYVLAVVMRTGRDDEGANRLYTIKSTSRNGKELSHVVAFQDRGDATNFCYLLQSFFEKLEGFSTDIVPLPIKDLDKAVTSNSMKVVVVKKGQLELYAGQPLTNVEMTLRSLVGQANLQQDS